MYKEMVIHIGSLIFENSSVYKSIRFYISDPMGNKWIGDIEYIMFSYILLKFKKFRFENLSKISITRLMSNSNKYDLKFELKRKDKFSIIFKIYQKCNNNSEWEKLDDLKFKNFIEFDDFLENLSLLTKFK